MHANQNHAILAKAKPMKPSCDDAQAEPSAVGRFPRLSMLLWHRTVWSPVIVLVAALSIDISSAQTSLINGANQTGTIFTNTTADSYTFTANKGDNIVLRLGTTGFTGNLDLHGPDGALLKTAASATAAAISYTATDSGTFTVLVSSYFSAGTGSYVLRLAQFPEAFIVPAGDEGGPMTNGGNHAGTNSLADLDMWSFTATAGDNIVLRLGTTGFAGNLNLYGPNGALLKTATSGTDTELDYTATNTGTFTALVYSYFADGTGTYVLHLAEFPEAFIVPAGDEGGPMAGVAQYYGTITLGDLDIWAFTACTGDSISLRLNPTNFTGNLNLYGPNGALLNTAASATAAEISYTTTNCGTFTVLVSSYSLVGTGTYGLTANGLSDELRVCSPAINGANLTLNGVGGTSNADFVLYSTTNVATPFGLWTPILTNHFDQFGVFNYTTGFNRALPQTYFRITMP